MVETTWRVLKTGFNQSCFFFFSEDILKRDNAIWISPDGTKFVYATFNDSLVQEVNWKIYGNPEDAIVDPYPKEGSMRYPKVRTSCCLQVSYSVVFTTFNYLTLGNHCKHIMSFNMVKTYPKGLPFNVKWH